MSIEEQIIGLLGRRNKALDALSISRELGFKSDSEYLELVDVLNRLSDCYDIYCSNKGRYMLFDRSPLKKGKLVINRKGFGFVDLPGDDDIFIASDNLNGGIHGDIVICEVTGKKENGKTEGRILKVISRSIDKVVGEVIKEKNKYYVKPDEDKLKIMLSIDFEDLNGAVEESKVVATTLEQINDTTFKAKVIEVLGHKNDPGIDILSISRKYDIEDTFPEEVIEQLKTIPYSVTEEEMEGRLDLRNEMIFTIDGADTKDIDDAVSCEKLKNGNYKLGVHIADVAHYVKEDSALDINACNRGTSVYLVDRVIPMIPHQLSNGICSLNEDVDRLAVSCIMEIDENANIVNYDLRESVIHSNKKMTYTAVNSILEDGIIPEGYEKFADTLRTMYELSQVLRKNKLSRGYLDFDVDEAKIIVDEKCHPIEIKLRERGTGENLIEDFMIIANECVASHIFYLDLPGIYRIHEEPMEDKIRDFLGYIGTLGYVYKGKVKDISPLTVQGILDFVKDKKEAKILSSLLLRNMKKAVYSMDNVGHFGLGSKIYTHFTSPIRRYPDTTVHRLLKDYVFHPKMSQENINKWDMKLPFIAQNSSDKERASVNCEREVESMKMAEYMEDHIGERFTGMITSIVNFGMFIQLDNLVEGMCRFEDMDDFYHYNDKTLTATGEKKHKVYKMGDIVTVKVISASKEQQTIDFMIVNEENSSKKEKGSVEEIELI